MSNTFFKFKQFTIQQDKCAMKVTTDSCLFGAWVANKIKSKPESSSSAATTKKYCLDIGTGTGLLALMLAQNNTELYIDAIEIDSEACEQAEENIFASPWKNKIKIQNTNAIAFNSAFKYNIIISNPPFYENELKAGDKKKNMAHHNEGLKLPELIQTIKNNLCPDGLFYLLLPFKRNEEIKRLFLEHEIEIIEIIFVRQSVNHDYFRMLLSGKLKEDKPSATIIDELSIKDEKDDYSQAFISLLKDYYLYL
jgi:tRNA1Val (adenine37-N6)-methyltransferase